MDTGTCNVATAEQVTGIFSCTLATGYYEPILLTSEVVLTLKRSRYRSYSAQTLPNMYSRQCTDLPRGSPVPLIAPRARSRDHQHPSGRHSLP